MMGNHNCPKMMPWLLLVGGLVHLFPGLYAWLSDLTGGTAYIQMIVGLLSVIGAIASLWMCKKCQHERGCNCCDNEMGKHGGMMDKPMGGMPKPMDKPMGNMPGGMGGGNMPGPKM